MGWRSVVVSNPAKLSLHNHSMVVEQAGEKVSVPIEDLSFLVFDCLHVSMTATLLSNLAERDIAVLFTDDCHLPNAVLLPYNTHFQSLKVMNTQLQMGLPKKKRLWKTIVKQKIRNQADVLRLSGKKLGEMRLRSIVERVRPGDPDNLEAYAAQVYFSELFGKGFSRNDDSFLNAAFDYGYSIIRSSLARFLVSHGFLTAFGLHHRNERNPFNLADDLVEPFRPILDAYVMEKFKKTGKDHVFGSQEKKVLVRVLHEDVRMNANGKDIGKSSLMNVSEEIVKSLYRGLLDERSPLIFPVLTGGRNESGNKEVYEDHSFFRFADNEPEV
jgi:CRISPR-associated protein Cas1